MYAHGKINWDDGTVKNICLATFSAGFKNLLSRLTAVQATQLLNLFMTVFTTKAEDNDGNNLFNPLNSLMSLIIFPPKFTKGHLNASFQSADLKSSTIYKYKCTSINPFQYAPQNNQELVQAATNEIEEERNKINWRIVKKDRKQISLLIEGVRCINLMEDVAMTCANICGMQIAIVDVASAKPLLYQFAIKLIKFIKNKKTKTWMLDNVDSLAHLPMVFMAKLHQFFWHLALFSQNLINTNKIKLADTNSDSKNVTIAVKLAQKFLIKMQEHINNNSIPKDVPALAKIFSQNQWEMASFSWQKVTNQRNWMPLNPPLQA
jgi:hypothetical protein